MTSGEYATLVYFWHGAPFDGHDAEHPDKIPELLSFVQQRGFGRHYQRDIATVGVVLGLELRYPGRAAEWRLDYPELYREVDHAVTFCSHDPAWGILYVMQWFITGDLRHLDALLDLDADGGAPGYFAREAITLYSAKSVPFRTAIQQAKELRSRRMVLNVTN